MQTKSGFMDDRDENGEYRDYDDVGQTEKKTRWRQIFIIIRTQVVHADSDIDQDMSHSDTEWHVFQFLHTIRFVSNTL